jgi:tetratricopeptide (TPR) repeat protein
MKKKTLPENHPSIGDALNNLRLVYSDLGDNNKAIYFYQVALEVQNRPIINNKSIADTLYILGNEYSSLGDNN